MFSQTRTALEQFDNQHDFERMAADILNALGHKDVVLIAPRGGGDGGRDITFTTESGGKGLACVTLRGDIDRKFDEDFSRRQAGEYEKYIFFCTAYLYASQKLQFTKYCVERLQSLFIPYDIEALRSLLDSSLKLIREKYLGIQDSTSIRRKIKNILFDPQNEVEMPRRWQMLLLDAPLDMIGLFDFIKDKDISLIAASQDEFDILTAFIEIFIQYRKLTSDIDNYVYKVLTDRIQINMPSYYQDAIEYMNLRLLGEDSVEAAKRIRLAGSLVGRFDGWEKIYEDLLEDQELKGLLERLKVVHEKCMTIRDSIVELKGFKVEY